jgi:RND family efflux transporter MFP subunit
MKHHRITPWLLGAGMALLAACGGDSDAVEAEHEHESSVVTQWNQATELFMENPPLVAGQQTGNWAIHLSRMSDFKPITEGALTVRFVASDGTAKSFQVDAPARDGIFLLNPEAPAPGTYRVELALNSPQARSTHVVDNVRVYASEEQIPHAEGEEAAGGIAFLKEQQWKIAFAVAPAAEQEVSRSVAAPGEIVPIDGALVQVSAPVSGIAQAGSNRGAPSVGQRVRAGEVLAVLAPTSEDGSFAQSRGNLERLQREVARAERLYAVGAIPEKRLEEARHDLEIAGAEIAAMGGGAGGDYRLRVRVPISGTVAERNFVPGGRVAAGEPLFTIVDPRRVWLRVRLPAAAASAVPRDARASFTVEGTPRTFSTGPLVAVGSVLDPESRTVPATFEVDNAGGLIKVGQFARAVVPVGGTVRGVAIPDQAILDDNGTPVAYVQTEGETFERRVLTLGESDGERTQVVDGIRPGEMVVTTGAYQVRLASLSPEGFSGGHAH